METLAPEGGKSLVQTAYFWIGIFVATAVLGCLISACDSSDKEPVKTVQDTPKKEGKKKNKKKQPKQETKPVDTLSEDTPVEEKPVPKPKAKKAPQQPQAAAPKKQAVAKPVQMQESSDSDFEQVTSKKQKKQPVKKAEPAKKQEPAKKKQEQRVVTPRESDIESSDVAESNTAAADNWNEWNDVKTKKQHAKPKQSAPREQESGSSFGGKTAKGFLVAGPVQQEKQREAKHPVINHASVVADYDYGVSRDEKSNKFEKYSHVCGSSVAHARMEAKLTQAQLATKINERPSAITELENCTGRYNADLVNRIEKALQVSIPRGRGKSSAKK